MTENREKVIRHITAEIEIARMCKKDFASVDIDMLADALSLLKEQDAQDATDIRDIDGLWCDDITFCPELCNWESCPRNQQNIRDKTIPHSFSVEIPDDCPKWQ